MANKAPQQKPGRSESSVGTPPEFIAAVLQRLGIERFAWDLAASAENAVCRPFFTEEHDALTCGWPETDTDEWLWLNPPYSDIGPWVARARQMTTPNQPRWIAVLVPAAIGANWWVEHVEGKAAIIPLQGRIVFVGHADTYPKDLALLLYGPNIEPGYLPAWKWMDTLTPEEKQMAKKRVDATRAASEKVRPIAEGRKKKRTPPPENKHEPETAPDMGRITTFQANAPATLEPAPEVGTVDLGPILLPSPDDAVRVLAELAGLNDRALQAQAVYQTLKERTKAAKEKYDDLAAQVITRLRVSTHASDLPLFDSAGDDLVAMLGSSPGIDVEGTGGPQDAPDAEQPQESAYQEIAF